MIELLSAFYFMLKKNDLLKVVLNDAANDLYKAILDKNERTIATFYNLLNEPGIARQVFQTGWMRTLCITDKKAQELSQKISEGKYEEVINAIRKRQALMLCVASVVMIILTVGLAVSAILAGVAAGLTAFVLLAVFSDGLIIGWNTSILANNVRQDQPSIIKNCCITTFITLQVVAIVALAILEGAIFPVIGIAAAGAMVLFATLIVIKAISHSSNKIEIHDRELATENKSCLNESSKSEVSDLNHKEGNGILTEEKPNAEVTQINLEKGTGREEDSVGNDSTLTQSVAV